MSWWNANEYFMMDVSVRDRVDDLRATADVTLARAEDTDDACGDGAEPDREKALCCEITCRPSTRRPALNELRAAR